MDIRPAADTRSPSGKAAPVRRMLLWIIAAAALFWLLREAFTVLMPVMAGLLLALAVWPLADAIRARVPRALGWLGALTATLAVFALLVGFFTGLGFAVRSIYDLAIEVAPQLGERLADLPVDLTAMLPIGEDPGEQASAITGDIAAHALTALNMTVTTLGGITLVLFLMLMMLNEAPNWNAKLRTVTERRSDAHMWRDIGRSVGAKFRAYFLARLLIGVVSGVLYGGFLFAFGIEYALLWGMLAILLSFIPTIGSIISGVLPTIYVFITHDLGDALVVGAGLLVIEQVLGNLLDPMLMGRRLAISPLVVLVSLVLWALLWGLAGALLAVPLTVFATVVMAHFEALKPAALLLTECEDFSALDDYASAD